MNFNSTKDSLLFLKPDVVSAIIETGAVLLDLETKYFYSVNQSAWAILQLFETGVAPEQVQARVQTWSHGSANPNEIEKLIQFLSDEGWLVNEGDKQPDEHVVFQGEWKAPEIEKHRDPLPKIMTSAFDPTMPLSE